MTVFAYIFSFLFRIVWGVRTLALPVVVVGLEEVNHNWNRTETCREKRQTQIKKDEGIASMLSETCRERSRHA